jgi:hypothetical protein
MLRPVFLVLEHLKKFKGNLCSRVLVSFRQKMWDPTQILNGEPKPVRGWVLHAIRRTDAQDSSDKASKIASSNSLRIGTGLSGDWSVFGLEKLGLRR